MIAPVSEPPRSPVLDFIERYVAIHGRAPSPLEIRQGADFSQPGGIGRLCDALHEATVSALARRTAR